MSTTTPNYPCFCCGGAAHPATGDFDVKWGVQYCAPCADRRNTWWRGQLKRGVAGDGNREEGYQSFYEAADSSIRPEVAVQGTGFTKYVRVPNPKAQEKMSKRKGRWRAGPDLVRVPQGPEPWRPFVWRSVPRDGADPS